MNESPRCPRCGQPVEVPELVAGGNDAGLAAFLQEEGNTCLALTNALAMFDGHQVTINGVAIGIGGYGSMSPEVEAWAQQMGAEVEKLKREIGDLRVRLHHRPKP